jgi:hypothetical protein
VNKYLPPWGSVLIQKLIFLQLVTKFRAFHWIWTFITVFRTAWQLPLSWDRYHVFSTYFSTIHFNIMLQSTPMSSKWLLLSFRLPHLNHVHISSLTYKCHTIFCEEYKTRSHSLCNVIHPPLSSSILGLNIFLRILFKHPQTVYVPPKRRQLLNSLFSPTREQNLHPKGAENSFPTF